VQANIQEPVPVWPCPDWWLINTVVEHGTTCLEDLKAKDPPGLTTTKVMEALFPGNRESFRGAEVGMQFVSPNPYVNEERRYIVVRFSEVISQRQKVTLLHQEEENLYNIQSYLFVTLTTKSEPRLWQMDCRHRTQKGVGK
jgi:hypothetical protein